MKRFRAYFNRHREAPRVCSIDEGTQETEINCLGFVMHAGCRAVTQYNGQRPNEDSPVFWVWIDADSYRILDGWAHFRMHNAPTVIDREPGPSAKDQG